MLALSILVLAACSSSEPAKMAEDAGVEDTAIAEEPRPDARPMVEPTSVCDEGDECQACMGGECCDVLEACLGDPGCIACVGGDDASCHASPETHDRSTAYLECKGGACREDCIAGEVETSCDGLLEGILVPNCASCLTTSCCAEAAACHTDEGCWVSCFTEHEESACHGSPDGHALYHAFMQCASGSCDAECFSEM